MRRGVKYRNRFVCLLSLLSARKSPDLEINVFVRDVIITNPEISAFCTLGIAEHGSQALLYRAFSLQHACGLLTAPILLVG